MRGNRAFGLFLALSLIEAVACGGDDEDTQSDASPTGAASAASPVAPTTTAAPAPAGAMPLGKGTGLGSSEPGTPLQSGEHYSDIFAPRFVMTLDIGWGNAGQTPSQMAFLREPEPGDLALTFDSAGDDPVGGVIDELTRIPGTEATTPAETTLSGMPARVFDLTVVDEQVRIPALTHPYTSFATDRLRVWVLDVSGTTVKIIAEATDDEFANFVQFIEFTLMSLRFG
jgi:hypothetical protein